MLHVFRVYLGATIAALFQQIAFPTFNKSNLEFGEAMEVSVDVHHLDSFHGHHGDLRGDCQPDALVI